MAQFKFVIIAFIIWRLLLFIPIGIAENLLPYRPNQEFTNILNKLDSESIINNLFLYPWANFDGVHYLTIANNGYTTEARFFPLFPILISLATLMSSSIEYAFLAGLLLSNLFFLGSLLILFKIVKDQYSKETAKTTILALLIFPTSFFFAVIYSESLFLFLTLLSFYFAQKKKWLFASIAAMLLVSTRFVGIFIIPALIYEYLVQQKSLKFKNYLSITAIIFSSLTGLVAYSIFNYLKWGNMTYYLTAHTELSNGRTSSSLVIPIQTLFRYFKILTTLPTAHFEWWIALLEVSSFILGSILLLVAWRKKVNLSFLIFAVCAFSLPSLSGTFSGLPRYMLVIFPAFIALSLIKTKWIKWLYFSASGVLLFLLLIFFSRGYFVA